VGIFPSKACNYVFSMEKAANIVNIMDWDSGTTEILSTNSGIIGKLPAWIFTCNYLIRINKLFQIAQLMK
jgi:hypothetical protein